MVPGILQRIAASGWRSFLVLFFIGFSIRVVTLRFIPPDLIPPNPDWETGAVALSLVERGEFADPYLIPTGPTAHMPPLLVATWALLYKVAGYSYLGGLIRWLLVMAAHAAIFALLPLLAGAFGLRREIGVLGGFVGALIPHYPYELESFSALALAALMVVFVRRWQAGKGGPRNGGPRVWGRSLLLGILAGVLMHLQPVLSAVVAGFLLFELLWRRSAGTWLSVSAVVTGVILASLPWSWRNYESLGRAYFVRSNLGLELYVGNHPGAHGDIDVSVARGSFRHPRTDLAEAEAVRDLGEARYMAEKRREALDWIAGNPGEFLSLVVQRFVYFWGGPLHRFPAGAGYLALTILAMVGLWRVLPSLSPPQQAVLVVPLLAYPMVYYIVAYMPRYGYPVRWILFLMAAAGVVGGSGLGRTHPRSAPDLSPDAGPEGP